MRSFFPATLAAAFLLVVPAPARGDKEKEAKPEKATAAKPLDISKIKPKLVVYEDGKGHHLALVPSENSDQNLFYGDGKVFYKVSVFGYSRTGGKNSHDEYNFWEPRVSVPANAVVLIRKGVAEVNCEERKTVLKPLPKKQGEAILEKASFFGKLWNRSIHVVARDDRGTYYFVDREAPAEKGTATPSTYRDFRLFIGPRGKLKPMKMKNIVADGEGEIFSTKSGDLRLITGKKEIFWVAGKKRLPLTQLDLSDTANRIVAFTDLGVYAGQRLGTPCDDL
jgi:hypothetical protein